MIAVKIDEDLPHDLVDQLRAKGIDAATVTMQSRTGMPDGRLIEAIQSEKRWLFTADEGFSDIRRYAPGSHHGIVFFRADRESRAAYLHLAHSLLEHLNLANFPGALIVVTVRSIRIVRSSASDE